jgi:hypothetical protein
MQSLKRAVKRIAAIGTGLAMLGATMTGALAQPTLDDYPAPFIVDGKDAGNIVIGIGAEAKSADTIGAIDIATQLQSDAKVCVPDSTSAGNVHVAGDAVEVSHASDLLELRENLGSVRETLTDVEVTGGGLSSATITTDEGQTDYNQYIRFKDTETPVSHVPEVVFTESEGVFEGYVGDYMYIADSQDTSNASTAFFEYELEFESGLKSDVDSNGNLEDLEDETLDILGTTYSIVDTDLDTATAEITLTLLGGAVYDLLNEGEVKTYTIDGKDYEVNVLIIEDVSVPTVTFEINGEVTRQLKESETTVLNDGTLVGISDIVLNEAGEPGMGDMVEMYLGASKLELKDTEYNDTSFYSAGATIDNDEISNSLVKIRGTIPSTNEFEITTIQYRLSADSLNGVDIWVEPGHGIREYLDEPQGMLGTGWDIRYEGLDDIQTSILKFDPQGTNSYKLIFENRQGLVYNVPFLTNEDQIFKYGNDKRDFVFKEGMYNSTAGNATEQNYTIGHLDYFVLSDVDSEYDKTAISHVVRYDRYESSDRRLKFEDMATSVPKEVTYTPSSVNGTIGQADLVFGGSTYKVYVANATGTPPLAVDLNGNGTIGNEEVRITINGGGILDLGNHSLSMGGIWTPSQLNNGSWSNVGQNITYTGDNFVTINLSTLSEDFDEGRPQTVTSGTLAEGIELNFTNRSDEKLGIIVSSLVNGQGGMTLEEDEENDDYYYGMTDYGTLFTIYDPSSTDNPETLTIEYPLAQRGARVFVTFGDTTTTKTASGEICTVADLSLSPLIDDEITNPADYNLILVGGPCANSVVADLFMACEDWSYGAGEAVVKIIENGDNVAMLVAGTDADDTRRASKVLKNYEDNELTGSEMVV